MEKHKIIIKNKSDLNSFSIKNVDEKNFAIKAIDKGFWLVHSNEDQDMKEHWDWKVINPNNLKETLVDNKGAKKKNRSDSIADYSITWLEIQNVRGEKGWLKGNADYITFQLKDEILIVSRENLLDWLRKKITNKTKVVSPKNALYRLYQRKGRKDIISMVLIKDIKNDLKYWTL